MICHILCENNVLSSPYNGRNKLLAARLNLSTLDRTTFEHWKITAEEKKPC